jgi:hypothetical protein
MNGMKLGKSGLGEEFFDFFEEVIIRIERNPFHASSYDETYRSASFKKFPYEVIYLVDKAKLEVVYNCTKSSAQKAFVV